MRTEKSEWNSFSVTCYDLYIKERKTGTDQRWLKPSEQLTEATCEWNEWRKSWWQQQVRHRGCCCWAAYRETFLHRAVFWPKRRNRHADRVHFDLKTNAFLNNIWSYDTHTLILHTHRAHTPVVYSSFSGSLIKSQCSNIDSVSVLPPGGPEGIAGYCILILYF